ncbi:MAG: class I SAM-dependent methyltransferase [Chloroflexota bacterium]
MLRRIVFNLWYFRRPPWDSGVSPPELIEFMDDNPPGRALDLGCGTGTNVVALARRGWDATGVDYIPRAISLAKRKAKQAKVNVILMTGDVTRLSGVDGPFDLILDMGCFHGLSRDGRSGYLKSVSRLLAPRGTWMLYARRVDETSPSFGLTEDDIAELTRQFRLQRREDSLDARGRASSWFWFKSAAAN